MEAYILQSYLDGAKAYGESAEFRDVKLVSLRDTRRALVDGVSFSLPLVRCG